MPILYTAKFNFSVIISGEGIDGYWVWLRQLKWCWGKSGSLDVLPLVKEKGKHSKLSLSNHQSFIGHLPCIVRHCIVYTWEYTNKTFSQLQQKIENVMRWQTSKSKVTVKCKCSDELTWQRTKLLSRKNKMPKTSKEMILFKLLQYREHSSIRNISKKMEKTWGFINEGNQQKGWRWVICESLRKGTGGFFSKHTSAGWPFTNTKEWEVSPHHHFLGAQASDKVQHWDILLTIIHLHPLLMSHSSRETGEEGCSKVDILGRLGMKSFCRRLPLSWASKGKEDLLTW